MSIEWEIGREAQELDKKTIIERMKIQRRSINKIALAISFYLVVMIIFYFIL
ncbi:MAG: hypothetical protein ACFE8B_05620 [Candidatus Hermodarchaeota archaeon]